MTDKLIFVAMKADLRLLAIITVIGISHGQAPVERGDVDNDLSDHVSEITTTPQWHTFSPDVLLDRKLADGVYIDPEKFEASIHVTLDGVYCIEKINLYFKRQTDESFDFTFNGFGFFGNGHPPDGSQLGVTVELESAESELYKECESGKLSDTFSILRDGKSETFYLMELVPVGVKAGTTFEILVLL